MDDDRSPTRALPEALTQLLVAPGRTINPTPDGRNRRPFRPRRPLRRAAAGVWLWALMFNVAGFAILAALWRSMG